MKRLRKLRRYAEVRAYDVGGGGRLWDEKKREKYYANIDRKTVRRMSAKNQWSGNGSKDRFHVQKCSVCASVFCIFIIIGSHSRICSLRLLGKDLFSSNLSQFIFFILHSFDGCWCLPINTHAHTHIRHKHNLAFVSPATNRKAVAYLPSLQPTESIIL